MRELTSKDIQNEEDLAWYFTRSNINISKRWKWTAKTISHLRKEFNDWESKLLLDENWVLAREVNVIKASIYHTTDWTKLMLKEVLQIFADGRERVRDLEGSLFEKLNWRENPGYWVVRGMKEELGIILEPADMIWLGYEEEENESWSYPGLWTKFMLHTFVITLQDRDYKSEGYVEIQDDKLTVFNWRTV